MDNTKKLFKYKEISKAKIVQVHNMTIWIDNGLGFDELWFCQPNFKSVKPFDVFD